jgi:glycosyltransferase involved in cell wall biosynthesis
MAKVVMLAPTLGYGGGTETVLKNLFEILVDIGFDVKIVVRRVNWKNIDRDLLVNSVTELRRESYSRNPLVRLKNSIWYKHRLRTDYSIRNSNFIISHSPSFLFDLPKHYFEKVISLEHWPASFYSRLGPKYKAKASHIYRSCSKVVLLTQREEKRFNEDLLVHNTVVIPNPDMGKLQLQIDEEDSRIVLAVGHLNSQKRFDRLLEIWGILKGNIDNEWSLWIVGDGEYKQELVRMAQRLELSKVSFIKPTSRIAEIYSKASILVSTSDYEALPMVMIEARRFNLPIVSFNIDSGPSDIIRHNVDGYLVDPFDLKKFADLLSDLIMNDNKRILFGMQGKKNAAILFSRITIEKEWKNLLESEF